MKHIVILLAFLPVHLLGQASLRVNVLYCKSEEKDTIHLIKIFKSDSLYQTLSLKSNQLDTTLKNLNLGLYRFKYTSIFNEFLSDSILLTKDSLYWKPLCLDDFKNTNNSFRGYIDSLKNNEFFSIEYEAYGCFHWESQKIKIFKRNGQTFSTLYTTKHYREKIIEQAKPITIQLTPDKVIAFLNFQGDIYKNATGFPFSTEMTFYTVVFHDRVLKFTDAEEGRERFHILKKKVYNLEK